MKKDCIFPSYIDNTDFRYIQIDNKYIASLIIYDFPRYNTFLSITEAIPKDIKYSISTYVQKQDSYKVLKELMQCISTSKSEIKTSNSSQIDIDIINNLKDDANFLRKEIQINNQEVFYINFILTFYSNSIQDLFKTLKRFQSKLYSKQLYSKITNFRHLEEYILSLPLNRSLDPLLKQNFKNFTTNSFSNFFPFYTKTIFDPSGVIFGKILSENSICNINMFKKNYLNSNMCILGSSGAGKSFFAKLLIIRHFINNKNQYIFDIEGEYTDAVKSLGGTVFFLEENHINILQFTKFEISMYGKKVFNFKINKIIEIINTICRNTDDQITEDIKYSIKHTYNLYNINENVESLYVENENKVYLENVIKDKDCFPTLQDVIENVKLKKSKEILQKIIKEHPYICGKTDVDFDNKIVSFDISKVNIKKEIVLIKYILEQVITKIKTEIGTNSLIYIDEIWKYISCDSSEGFSSYIFELFKTIRKLNASIVVITQDISDIFSKENLDYGKSILNNCFFKMIFRLDFQDLEVLNKISGFNKNTLDNVNSLDKGQGLLLFNNNNIKLLIEASEYEKKLIEGEKNEYISCTR